MSPPESQALVDCSGAASARLRALRMAFALAPAVALWLAAGCSGSSTALPGASPDAAAADLAAPHDIALPVPDLTAPVDEGPGPDYGAVNCGSMTCAQGLTCCLSLAGAMLRETCAASCDTDGGAVPLVCDGPDTCPGRNPCCVRIGLGGGMPMTGGAMCQPRMDACATGVDFIGQAITTRLCHRDVDCAGAFLGQPVRCCSLANAPIHFCAAPFQMNGFNITCP